MIGGFIGGFIGVIWDGVVLCFFVARLYSRVTALSLFT